MKHVQSIITIIDVFKNLVTRNGQIPLFQAYLALARIYELDKDFKNALLTLREMEMKFQNHSDFEIIKNKILFLEKST